VGSMDVVQVMMCRRSTNYLVEPAPNNDEIRTCLAAAGAAPDHGRLRPWRFIELRGAAKTTFGEILVQALKQRCETSDELIERERTKLDRAPLVLVSVASPTEGKIPAIEQVCAVAAATQNLILCATALGYGSMWRTGQACYDDEVKDALGLHPTDHIVGFIYLGSLAAPLRPRGDVLVPFHSWEPG